MSAEFDVKVVPRSRQNRIELLPDGSLRAWLHAPPVDGQANEALFGLLSKALKVPKGAVELLRGESSRNKRIRVEGIELSEAQKRLS